MATTLVNNSNLSTVVIISSDELFSLSNTLEIVLTIVMSLVLIVTVLGNLAVMIVFASSNLLQLTVNNHFLFSLALADLLVGILVMPCAIDAVRTQTWRCGEFMKQFTGFGNFFFCISSIMHLMILSVDKYLSIIKPLKYHSIMTQRRVYILCTLLWSYSAFWAFLPLMGVSSYECFIPYIGVCAPQDWSMYGLNFVFAVSVVSGTYGVALLVMIVVYWKIARTIKKQEKKVLVGVLENTGEATDPRNDLQLKNKRKNKIFQKHKGLLTLVILIMTYLICWSPFCVLLFIEIGRGKKVDSEISLIGMLIGFTNSCCNPIIYWAKYKSFRRAILRMLRKSLPFLKNDYNPYFSEGFFKNNSPSININRVQQGEELELPAFSHSKINLYSISSLEPNSIRACREDVF